MTANPLNPYIKLTTGTYDSYYSNNSGANNITPSGNPGYILFDLPSGVGANSTVNFSYTVTINCNAPNSSGSTITDQIGIYPYGTWPTTAYSSSQVSLAASLPGGGCTGYTFTESGSNPSGSFKYAYTFPYITTVAYPTAGNQLNTSSTITSNLGSTFVRRVVYLNDGTSIFNGSASFTDVSCLGLISINTVNVYESLSAAQIGNVGTYTSGPNAGQINPATVTATILSSSVPSVSSTLTSTTWTVPFSAATVNIPMNGYIIVEEVGTVTGCISTSCASTLGLAYGCSGATPCKNAPGTFSQIDRGTQTHSIAFSRVLRGPNYAGAGAPSYYWDASCMDNTTPTNWEFVIQNTGTGIEYNVLIDLNKEVLGSYTYIDQSSVNMNATDPTNFPGFLGNANAYPLNLIAPPPQYTSLTAANFPVGAAPGFLNALGAHNPIQDGQITVPFMNPNDIIIITFSTYRVCPQGDNFMYNKAFTFNQWHLNVTGYDECSNQVNGTQSNRTITYGAASVLSYASDNTNYSPNGISGNQDETAVTDLQLYQYYAPAFTDLLGSPTCSQAYNFQIENVGFPNGGGPTQNQGNPFSNEDDQIYCATNISTNTYGATPTGQFQVVFVLQDGLQMINPGNSATCNITPTNGSFPVWNQHSYLTQANTPAGYTTYTFTFYVSEFIAAVGGSLNGYNFADAMNHSLINFQMAPCCPVPAAQNGVATYQVYTNFMPQPNLGCSCWVPLAYVNGSINIHCPGCVTPGFTVAGVSTQRTNLGYEDVTNSDIATASGSTPIPITSGYSKMSKVKKNYVIVGDQILDSVSGVFNDASPCIGCEGFSFGTWQSTYGSPGFQYVYLEKVISAIPIPDCGEQVQIQNATLYYTSAGVTYPVTLSSGTDWSYNSTTNSYAFSFSLANLITRGVSSSITTFSPDDIFLVVSNYTIGNNVGQTTTVIMEDYMFASANALPNPAPATYFGTYQTAGDIMTTNPSPPVSGCPPASNILYFCAANGTTFQHFQVSEGVNVTWDNTAGNAFGSSLLCDKTAIAKYTAEVVGPYYNIFPYEFRVIPPVAMSGMNPFHFDITLPPCYSVNTLVYPPAINSVVDNAVAWSSLCTPVVVSDNSGDITMTSLPGNVSEFTFATPYGARLSATPSAGGPVLVGDEQFELDLSLVLNPACNGACDLSDPIGPSDFTVTVPTIPSGCTGQATTVTLSDPSVDTSVSLPNEIPLLVNVNQDVTTNPFCVPLDIDGNNWPSYFYIYIPVTSLSFMTGYSTWSAISSNSTFPYITSSVLGQIFPTYVTTSGGVSYFLFEFPNTTRPGTLEFCGTLAGCPTAFPATYPIPVNFGASCTAWPQTSPFLPSSSDCIPVSSGTLNLVLNDVTIHETAAVPPASFSTCAPVTVSMTITAQTGGAYMNHIALDVPLNTTVVANSITLTTSAAGNIALPPLSSFAIEGPLTGYTVYGYTLPTPIVLQQLQTATLSFEVVPTACTGSVLPPNDSITGYKYCSTSNTLSATTGFSNTIAISDCDVITLSPNSPLCSGGGAITASMTPAGVSYSWSGPPSPVIDYSSPSQNLSGLVYPGTYTVTVTDANGCTTAKSTSITIPAAIAITPAQTNIPCGGSTGSFTLGVSGGTPAGTAGYTYTWSPAIPVGDISTSTGSPYAVTATGLGAGTYTVTVTDGNLCNTVTSFTITTLPAQWPQSILLNTNPSNGAVYISSTKTDLSNNVFVGGAANGDINIQGTIISVSSAAPVFFLAKYNECGVLLWVKTASDVSPYVFANASMTDQNLGIDNINVEVDANGDAYLSGNFMNHIDFPSTPYYAPSSGNDNIMLIKFSGSSGSVLWSDEFTSTSNNSYSFGTTLNGNGSNLYMIGETQGNGDLNFNNGVTYSPFEPPVGFVACINTSTGTVTWAGPDYAPIDGGYPSVGGFALGCVSTGTTDKLIINYGRFVQRESVSQTATSFDAIINFDNWYSYITFESSVTNASYDYSNKVKTVYNGSDEMFSIGSQGTGGYNPLSTNSGTLSSAPGYTANIMDLMDCYEDLTTFINSTFNDVDYTNRVAGIAAASPAYGGCYSNEIQPASGIMTINYRGSNPPVHPATVPVATPVWTTTVTGTSNPANVYQGTVATDNDGHLYFTGGFNTAISVPTALTNVAGTGNSAFIARLSANPGDGGIYKSADAGKIAENTQGINNGHMVPANILGLAPNPASLRADISYVLADDPDQPAIRIYDVLGQVVKTMPISGPSGTLDADLSNLAPGAYTISLENNGHKVLTRRLVKE